jgi:peroxiredoxin family protein
MGWEVSVFFTFYGLDVINTRKNTKLKVASLGNPAAPVPVPNILGAIPGMTWMATKVMGIMFRRSNIPDIQQMLGLCDQLGVKLIGCSTTMGVMGVKKGDLREGASVEGAAAFLHFASRASVTLFV